jgi:hypothetical protein
MLKQQDLTIQLHNAQTAMKDAEFAKAKVELMAQAAKKRFGVDVDGCKCQGRVCQEGNTSAT